jgi:uncharacterized membrane protein YgaE (UPF0421/DUF939 family)
MRNETSPTRLRIDDWLDAVDPGRLRLHDALRATLVMFATWVIVYFITKELGWYYVGVGVFALLASFIGDLVMHQVPPDSRIIALPMVFIPMVAATLFVALIDRDPFLTATVAIMTFYLAYFLRRYGAIFFLIGFIAVAMFYFSFLLRADQANMEALVFAIGVAVIVNFIFWFILMPTRPGPALIRGVKAYYRRSHRILLAANQALVEGSMDKGRKRSLDIHLRRLTESRRMMEVQMMDISVSHPSLSEAIERMKIDLFSTERATRLLVKDIEELSNKVRGSPPEVRKALLDLMDALAVWMDKPTSEDRQKEILVHLNTLRDHIRTYESDGSARVWIVGLVQLYLDGSLLKESVLGFIGNFERSSAQFRARKEGKTKILPPRQPKSPLPMTTLFGRWKISIASLMAIQALTAAFIAMGVAELLGLSTVIQSFWFALITVSGSLGATKVKSLSRVIGTVLGVGLGLALGYLAGEIIYVTIAIVLVLFFIMEFTRTISLNWFILCIIAIGIVATAQLGMDLVDGAKLILISSMIGVGAALLATTVLFPIKVRQRYRMALSSYLATTDRYLRSFNERVRKGLDTVAIDGSNDLDQKQSLLEASSQENLYEANPFSPVDRESSYEMTTAIHTLHLALVGLRNKQKEDQVDEHRLNLLTSLIEVISRNITTISKVLESQGVKGSDLILDEGQEVMHTLEGPEFKWSADVGFTPFRSYMKDLLQVHGIILELGRGIINEEP